MYNLPNAILINDTELPYSIGTGLMDPNTIVVENNTIKASYYEQHQGQLTEKLVLSILLKEFSATVTRYLDGRVYAEKTERTLDRAFFKSFHIKRTDGVTSITPDEPLMQFANEINNLGAYTMLWDARFMYFPAGFLVQFQKPLLDDKTRLAWVLFTAKYYNTTGEENGNILKYGHSPFSEINMDGTGIVLPVFLKDALQLIKEQGLMGDTKESAFTVHYV